MELGKWRAASASGAGQGTRMAARGGEAATAFDSTLGACQVSPGAGAGGARGARGTGRQGEWPFDQQDQGACGRGCA